MAIKKIFLLMLMAFAAFDSFAQDAYLPVNLGNKVNSRYSELTPIISADGRELYFLREMFRKAANEDIQSLWYSKQDEKGEWGLARYMAAPFNNGLTHSAITNVSPDNNTIIIKGYFKNGTRVTGTGYSVVTRNANGGWKTPVGIEIEGFAELVKGKYVGATLTPDGKAMMFYFSEEKDGANNDLYISFKKEDGGFTRPAAIKALNTGNDDASPFVALDNKTLYFSSDRPGGLGDNDIYKTTRLDDTWQKWSEPVNLGPSVNSAKWDSYFRLSAKGDYAYMISSKEGGFGESDIVRIKLNDNIKPQPVVLVKGRVLNKKTLEPIEAAIIYEDLANGNNEGIAISDPGTGAYQIVLPYGKDFGFNSSQENYIPISDNLDLTKVGEYQEITRDLYMVPFEKGQVVRINNIFFEFGKADLKPESFPDLNRLVALLQSKPKLEIELGGHTDNVGTDDANNKLSAARAFSVVKYLTTKGIAAARLKASGYGKTRPVTTNDTDEGRAQNRRVEFTILNY
jgi:OOP family OmpA-OmpF porin